MAAFRIWLENLQSDRDRKIQEIWSDAFKSLGIGGLADEDAAYQSLGKITYGQRSPVGHNTSTFKGKKAAYKRLENGQIFTRLLQLQDPQITKQVEDAKSWLGTNDDDPKTVNNADTTVATLMQKLFGPSYHRLIDSDGPVSGGKLTSAPPMPPNNNGEPSEPPDLSQGEENPIQTPQSPMANQQYQPQVKRPPRPAPSQMMPSTAI